MNTRNNAQHEAKTKEWHQSRPTDRTQGSPSSNGKNPPALRRKSTHHTQSPDSHRGRRHPTEIIKAIELREGALVQIIANDGVKMRQEPRPWKEIEFLGLIQEVNSIQITDFNGSLVLSEYNHEKWWKEDSIVPGCVILAFDETPATPRTFTQSLAKKLEKTSSKGGEYFYDMLFWIPDEGKHIISQNTIPSKTYLEYVGVKGISAVFKKGKNELYCDLDVVIKQDQFQLVRQGPERVIYEPPPPTPPPLTRTFRRLPSAHRGEIVKVEKRKTRHRKEKDHEQHDTDNDDAAKSSKHHHKHHHQKHDHEHNTHRKHKKHHHENTDDAEGEGEGHHHHHGRRKKKKKKHKKHASHSRSASGGRSRSKSKSQSRKSRSKSGNSGALDETGKITRTRIRSKRVTAKKASDANSSPNPHPINQRPMSAIAAAKAARDRERNTPSIAVGAMEEARKVYLDSSQKTLLPGVEYVLNRSVTIEEEGNSDKKRTIPKDSHVVYVGTHENEQKITVVLIEIDAHGARTLSQLKIPHIDNIGYILRIALTKKALGSEVQTVAQREVQSIVTELHKKVKRSKKKESHVTINDNGGPVNSRETAQQRVSMSSRQPSHAGRETQQGFLIPPDNGRPTKAKSSKSSAGQKEKKSVRIVVKKSRIKEK